MKRVSVYMKLRVLGAIDSMPGNTIISRIKEVAKLTFHDEEGVPHVFTWRTIQTWLSIYKQGGVEMLKSRPRKDQGKQRKVNLEQLQEAIEQVRGEFREKRFNKMMIYRRIIEKGLISRSELSQTSFFRMVRKYELLKPAAEANNKRRLAFSKQYSNEMWQADTMFGPHVRNGRTSTQAKLIAFIDDASRVITHAQFFFKDDTEHMIMAFRSALYKRGVPQTLYVDNGSNYTSTELNQICARIGTVLCHAPVRDGAAKGKIERFFRTVRDNFLIRKLDLSSLVVLNRQFHDWVETEYNAKIHSTLQMKPIDRFGMDLKRLRFLDPTEANEELFFFEEDRSVGKDNTFPIKTKRYEAPVDLRSRKVQVRYNRAKPDRIIVYYKGQRMGQAEPLDLYANDRPPAAVRNNRA